MNLARTVLRSSAVAALTSPHSVDRYLELVHPMWAVHDVRARLVDVHRETPDVTTLTFRPTGTWRGFRAGQYVQLGVEIDGARRTRCFSLSSSDLARSLRGDPTVTVTVRAQDEGLVSRFLAHEAGPGLVVHLSQADGSFTLPVLLPRRLLMISGGSGITPVMSMVRSLVDFRYEGRITFLHYSRDPEHTIFRAELRELDGLDNVDVHLVHTRDGGERFGADHLSRVAPDFARTDTYACGPAGLVGAVKEVYVRAGAEDRLRVEYFKTSTLATVDDSPTGTVTFARTGTSAANTGATLLEQAEASGLRPEHGCRMGICRSCTSRKTEGTVRNVVTGAESSPGEEDIQICVSQPVGDCAVAL